MFAVLVCNQVLVLVTMKNCYENESSGQITKFYAKIFDHRGCLAAVLDSDNDNNEEEDSYDVNSSVTRNFRDSASEFGDWCWMKLVFSLDPSFRGSIMDGGVSRNMNFIV